MSFDVSQHGEGHQQVPSSCPLNNGGEKSRPLRPHPIPMTACRQHLEGAAELERLCFSSPWSASSLELLTREGIGVGFVCVSQGAVVAYGGMLNVVDEGQITNIAVHPDHRRLGYGDALIRALLRHAKDLRHASVTLEVRASNAAALALYRKHGFAQVGCRRRFYTRPVEDALILVASLR